MPKSQIMECDCGKACLWGLRSYIGELVAQRSSRKTGLAQFFHLSERCIAHNGKFQVAIQSELPYVSQKGHRNKNILDTLIKHTGTCNIMLLLTSRFNDVPYDESTWNEIRGNVRNIMRRCILRTGLGGTVTHRLGKSVICRTSLELERS